MKKATNDYSDGEIGLAGFYLRYQTAWACGLLLACGCAAGAKIFPGLEGSAGSSDFELSDII